MYIVILSPNSLYPEILTDEGFMEKYSSFELADSIAKSEILASRHEDYVVVQVCAQPN